jgi:RNA polymerase sigma-70 factor (ECF subfamily)
MDPKELTDEQLMAATAKGAMAEFEELVRRHQQKAFALALRTLGQWDMAEDVSQEAFLRVLRSAKRYRPRAKFTTWLYRIVVNLCLDARRKARGVSVDISAFSDRLQSSPESDPAYVLEAKERKKRVWDALETLTKRERITVVLHRFHGLSHAEVSDATGWSRSAIESLLVRAYQKLRKKLAKE